MPERVLIIGAEGFVGRHLGEHLSDAGYAVLRTDRQPPEQHEDRFFCDITDPVSVETLIRRVQPLKAVFHLAALAHAGRSLTTPAPVMRVNIEGTVHVAEVLRRHSPKTRLIFPSTSQVYGPPQSLPVSEEHPLAPPNPYAISKAAAEQYLAYLHKTAGLDVVTLRLYNHTGPGQDASYVLSSFARQVARIEAGEQEPVVRVGNLEVERDFSHVTDIARAYQLAMEKGRPGAVYNVGSGRPQSIRAALDRLVGRAERKVEVEVDPERLRPADVPVDYADPTRFQDQTGWTPRITFEQLLDELLADWRKRIATGE